MFVKDNKRWRGFIDPLSLIGVTFLLIATVIGVTVVRNRGITLNPNKMAEDVYPSPTGGACSGSCYYGSSACSSLGLQNASGSCSGGICCGAPLINNCTNGDSYCVDSNTVAVCKVDKSGYTETDCASGSTCDSAQKKCIFLTTPTPQPTNCASTNQSCSNQTCCNSSDACEPLYGGKFCVAKGDCTSGATKCVAEGLTSFVYKCSSNGYWQKERACDFGCDGTSCKAVCTPGAKQCSGSELETCNSTGTAWTGQSCTDGCQTVYGVPSCKTSSVPTSTTNPTATPIAGSCVNTGVSCDGRSCCNPGDVCELVYGGRFCIKKLTSTTGGCSVGQTKCQSEGIKSYKYICNANGYFQKTDACDFGCDGTGCKTLAFTEVWDGSKNSCDGNYLISVNSSRTAYDRKLCSGFCTTSDAKGQYVGAHCSSAGAQTAYKAADIVAAVSGTALAGYAGYATINEALGYFNAYVANELNNSFAWANTPWSAEVNGELSYLLPEIQKAQMYNLYGDTAINANILNQPKFNKVIVSNGDYRLRTLIDQLTADMNPDDITIPSLSNKLYQRNMALSADDDYYSQVSGAFDNHGFVMNNTSNTSYNKTLLGNHFGDDVESSMNVCYENCLAVAAAGAENNQSSVIVSYMVNDDPSSGHAVLLNYNRNLNLRWISDPTHGISMPEDEFFQNYLSKFGIRKVNILNQELIFSPFR